MSNPNAYLKRIKSQAAKNQADGVLFFANNNMRAEVISLASGLQYEILNVGTGELPLLSSKILCHYRGTLLDGSVFDSSYQRKRPEAFYVRELIKGWQEALLLMPVGSTWKLFIPPELGYGFESVTASSGGNCTLIFEMELRAILEV